MGNAKPDVPLVTDEATPTGGQETETTMLEKFPAPVGGVPDITAPGPLAVAAPAEYKLPLTRDTNVVADANTELWAALYRPQDLSAGPYPLIVFMHGAHSVCSFTNDRATACQSYMSQTGQCATTVINNHQGYAYIAQKLAAWGYIVISINNNAIHC
ncbi:MAG TPA: hypothetical protein VFH51_13385, partial [Myxococcota bacterium]|nr:hypothetical protein [Myxococcota bacterium]